MRFRRFFTAAAATAAFGLVFTFGQGQAAQASINSDAKKTTYSGTKSLETLLKAAGLSYNQFNSVANGKKYGSRFGYRNGVGKPEGIVVHETATPGATAWDEGRYFNNNWTSVYSYVHAVVDNRQTIQLMSTDYGTWGAGPIANVRYIQIELCEVSTRSQFVQSVANDAYYIATLLHQYNLTPSRASKDGSGTIWSHNEVSQYLGGTDHGDPDGYFAKWGYSMSDFYSLITYYYNKLGTSSNSGNTNNNTNNSGSNSSSQAPATQPVSTKTVKLMRNSYSYDASGKKLAVKTLKAGSSLKVYGSAVTIGNSKYYKYAEGKYVEAGNIDGTSRTLMANAWTYTSTGSREWSTAKLLRGTKVTTYGGQVKIKGKAYYMTGFTRNNVAKYVKAINFQFKPVETTTTKRLMRNSYSYDASGKKLAVKTLKAGSSLKVYGSAVTIGNSKYYKYAEGKYVEAGNIDGTSRTLMANAWTYTSTGSREWSTAKLLRGTKVTTYGGQVKIKGKAYYMTGFTRNNVAKYVKAINFQFKPVETTTTKRLMRNSYSYDASGKKLSTAKLTAGSYLKVYGSAVTIGNSKYYKYAAGKYVKAGNIDGTSRTLTHNAYVYTVKGARNWNEAKRLKGRAVVTYGSRVKLSGKYYYMVGFSGQTALYIKAGNF